MSIVRRQPMAGAVAAAGQIIGESQKAQREAEFARQAAIRLQQIQLQKERDMFQLQVQAERDKMRQLSELNAEKRAMDWEVEKMSLRSQMDFQRTETKRQKKLAEVDARIKAIDESDILADDPDRKANLIWYEKYKAVGGEVSWRDVFPEEKEPKEEKPISESDIARAGKWLSEHPEAGMVGKAVDKLTFGALGTPALTPIEQQMKTHYQELLAKAGATESVPTESATTPMEPQSVAEFESTVAQLKTVNMQQAKAYYDQWARKF